MSYGYPPNPQPQQGQPAGYPPGYPAPYSATGAYPGMLPQGYGGYGYPPAEKKHSGIGIASFAVSLLTVLVMFGVIGAAAYLEITDPAAMESEDDPRVIGIGLGFLGSIALVLLGLILGVAGLLQGDRKKLFGILGVVVNVLIIVVVVGLIALGLAMGG